MDRLIRRIVDMAKKMDDDKEEYRKQAKNMHPDRELTKEELQSIMPFHIQKMEELYKAERHYGAELDALLADLGSTCRKVTKDYHLPHIDDEEGDYSTFKTQIENLVYLIQVKDDLIDYLSRRLQNEHPLPIPLHDKDDKRYSVPPSKIQIVLILHDAGYSGRQISELTNVSTGTISTIIKQYR